MAQDRARIQTDKTLDKMEREIGRVYATHPALLSAQKAYAKYMAMVKKRTEGAYSDFINEKDKSIKEDKKQAYMGEIRALTLDNKEYNKLVERITMALAEANQQALDISNKAMREVYAVNYNQVAEDCREVGIRVER